MRKSLGQCLVAAAALLIGTAVASAEEGFARASTNLRAGPDADYPVITGVRAGEPVFVYGCLSDYSWCDVRARRVRGWMQASRIELVYGGRRVLVQTYAPRIGVPVVRFDIGTYWDRNYRDYDWYDDRGRYDRRWVDRPRNIERGEFDRYERDVRRAPRPDFDRFEGLDRRDSRPNFERETRREQPPVVRLPAPEAPAYPQPQSNDARRQEQDAISGVVRPRERGIPPAAEDLRRRERGGSSTQPSQPDDARRQEQDAISGVVRPR